MVFLRRGVDTLMYTMHYGTMSGSENITINVDGNVIKKGTVKNPLVYTLIKIKFNEHLDSISKKVGRKVNALSRMLPYMNFEKRFILINFFFTSQFNYCPLTLIT